MITRLTGVVEAVEGNRVTVRAEGSGSAGSGGGGLAGFQVAIEILVPAFLGEALKERIGHAVTFHTLAYLEGQGQGTSFIPRLIGFRSPEEREFFELFTTVKGIGNRKALRALARPVGEIAAAVVGGHTRALVELPEIGKRMADTIIAELKGKVDRFVTLDGADAVRGGGIGPAAPAAGSGGLSVVELEGVEALTRLGELRAEAERKVRLASERLGRAAATSDELIAAVFIAR